MKSWTKVVACVGMLAGVGLLAAAAWQPKTPPAAPVNTKGMPCVVIQEIETDAPKTYALWIGEANKVIKEKFGLDNYRHVFVGESAGPDSGKVFAVSRGESFAAMAATESGFEKEVGLMEARLNMKDIRKLGANVSYKAVRWDGTNPNACVFNTRCVLSDESGYLSALNELRGLLDAHELKDIKINCYRVASGRTDFTHMVSLNCPSRERRAAMMDAISGEAWAQSWIASAAKYRTGGSNGTF